jgi:glycosyltransferase involved in cell wall biosynthesis
MIFTDYFFPGYKAGGILRSVYNMVNTIEEIDFYIITRNRDLGASVPYNEVVPDRWLTRGFFKVMYLSPNRNTILVCDRILRSIKPDFLYVNSIFSIRYTLLPVVTCLARSKITIIIAANGMLSPEAIALKHAKKILFLNLIRLLAIYKNVIWHATNDMEKNDIQRIFGDISHVKVAPCIVGLCDVKYQARCKKVAEVNLVFLSRITEIKNLLWAIQLLKKVKVTVKFEIIGPAENQSYFDKCVLAMRGLPENVKIKFCGEKPFNAVLKELTKHHFLFFPTLHENFGYVIVEAMQAGCPVIISQNTPFRNLEILNVGWDISFKDSAKWIDTIENCATMAQEKYNRMSVAAFKYGKKISHDLAVKRANCFLFQK